MRLFELATEFRNLSECADSGQDVGEAFDAIACAFEDKVTAAVHVMRDLELDADKLAAEIKRLTDRKRAIDGNATRLRERIRDAMISCDLRKVKAETFSITLSDGPERVGIADETLVPESFIRTKREVDKSAILAAYKQDGELVPGAVIERGTRLVIR